MSLYINFEPHSWYMGFAIKFDPEPNDPCEWEYGAYDKACIVHDKAAMPGDDHCEDYAPRWSAYTDDGNTFGIIERYADTLKELKQKIRAYHLVHMNGYGERITRRRSNERV